MALTDISFEALTYIVRFEGRGGLDAQVVPAATLADFEWGVYKIERGGRTIYRVSVPEPSARALARRGLVTLIGRPPIMCTPTAKGRALVRGQALR
jgi:hypothetical protein